MISEIDGTVKYAGVVKGQRKVLIVPDDPNAEPREYSIPRGVHVNVQESESVRASDPLLTETPQRVRSAANDRIAVASRWTGQRAKRGEGTRAASGRPGMISGHSCRVD